MPIKKIPKFVIIPLTLSMSLGIVVAADLVRMQQLAQSRYGVQAANTIGEWRGMMEQVRNLPEGEKVVRVNDFFNKRVRFMSDIEVWKKSDYWATPLQTMGRRLGDCEDFSIAKYMTLQLVGVPEEKLQITYVKAKIGGRYSKITQAHMVLGYYPNVSGEPKILDNLISEIRPASRRPDLAPVFSFNTQGLTVAGQPKPATRNPSAKLSRWRDLLARMQQEGL